VERLVQAGLAAAKAGQRAKAKALLAQATEEDPTQIQAWLWLSGVVNDLREREACMEKVLALEPGHPAATKGLRLVREKIITSSLREGVAAAKAGDTARARELLTEVAVRDEENVQAWFTLSEVVEDEEEREICLENVLTLDPDNLEARKRLEALQSDAAPVAFEAERETTWAEPGEQAPFRPAEEEPPPEGEVVADWRTLSGAEEDAWEFLDDEYGCPYCAAQTEPDERRCPECGERLWVKYRRNEGRSTGLWIITGLQALTTAVSGLLAAGLIYFFSQMAQGNNVLGLFASLIQLDPRLMPQIGGSQVLLYALYAISALPFLSSLFLLVGLFLRWPFVWYLLLIQAFIGMLSSLANVLLNANSVAIVSSLISAAISVAYFFFVWQLQEDFFKNQARILLRLDRDAQGGPMMLARGRLYAKEGMWALAALHFRRAGALTQNSDAYVALAIACMKLEAHGMAERALDEAERINPSESQISELRQLLSQQRGTELPAAA
jgi:tetratricopeptide (TPR) repeat protein